MVWLLSSGVDSLYVSARGDLSACFGPLRAALSRAQSTGEPVPWPDVEGFALEVLPYGGNGYPVIVECAEFRIYATDRKNRAPVWVQIFSDYLRTVGVEHAWSAALRAAAAIVGVALIHPKVSRIDLFSDFADWRLLRSDWDGLIRHAKVRAIGEPAPGEVETFQIGKSPLLARLYRKDIEQLQSGGAASVFWDGYPGPVVRVEVQASSGHLRGYRFGSVAEMLASCGDVWRHATSDRFLELRVPAPRPREEWLLRPEWKEVQRVGFTSFPHSGLVPQRIWTGDRERVRRLLYGCLSSVGAWEGVDTLEAVVRMIPREVAAIARQKDFRSEVKRKWRKRSRWERERILHSRLASAGARKEIPCAPEPSQLDTAPRTST